MRSPKCPKIAAPIGRATKPTAKTANACRTPVRGSDDGKYSLAKNQRRHLTIEQEIVPLDCRADRARDDRAAQLRAVIGVGKQNGRGFGYAHRHCSLFRAAGPRRTHLRLRADLNIGGRMTKGRSTTPPAHPYTVAG